MKEFFSPDPNTIGSKGLVYIGDRLLVYRRDGNTTSHAHELDLPGGGPEDTDKTPFETFRREVKEEFDLDIEPGDIVDVRRYESIADPNKVAYFPVARLAAEFAGRVALGSEGEESLLLLPEEYLQRTDAWPIFQQRTAESLHSLPTD